MVVAAESAAIWLSYHKQKRQNANPTHVYENPDVYKAESNPLTEDNIAYECIHDPRGEIPIKNITSQPQTQENVAYGQVELY